MHVSAISQQTYSASFFKTHDQASTEQDSNVAETQQIEVVAQTESVKISSGYDLTDMTSKDMLGLAKSFYEEGNTQDCLRLQHKDSLY